ncbi:MAG TPA: MarC family protein [Thermohalobaculum sp.]|nr:MarC family protein [Thermohalobaculum sp.]
MHEAAINAFVTMFVVIDPVSLAPLFVALTGGMSREQRLRVGLTALAVSACVLGLFALAGDALLGGIGISMPAFRIAGGLLLFLTALDMLFERRTARRERSSAAPDSDDDPSVFPLAIPLIAGPGAIASVILLMGRHEGDLGGQAMVLGVTLAVLAIVLLAFLLASPLERLLRRVGVMVVTRLLGMLLAALSVQFVLDGIADVDLLAR